MRSKSRPRDEVTHGVTGEAKGEAKGEAEGEAEGEAKGEAKSEAKSEAGMVGKLLAVWLIVLAIFAVAALDATSIVVAHFHTSDIASNAASVAANDFKDTGNANLACKAATDSIHNADPSTALTQRGGCKVNGTTGAVKITVTKHANTLVAGRLSATKKYVTITVSATATPGL